MSIIRVGSIVAAILLVGAASASAQAAGMVCGTVTDPSGAGLAGVTVTLTQRGDASTPPSTTTTATKGDYQFQNVPIGTFTVAFELEGFKKAARAGLTISPALEQRADQKMELGTPTTEVMAVVPVFDRPVVTGATYTKTVVTVVDTKLVRTTSGNPTPPRSCSAPR